MRLEEFLRYFNRDTFIEIIEDNSNCSCYNDSIKNIESSDIWNNIKNKKVIENATSIEEDNVDNFLDPNHEYRLNLLNSDCDKDITINYLLIIIE